MAVLPSGSLKASFANKTTPTGDDFNNLIDSTYGFPTSAINFTAGLTLTPGTTGLPVQINGTTYYIPLFTAA